MIKLVFCLARKPPLTREEFARYWRDEHAPLVRAHAEVLRIRRYTQSLTFGDPRLQPPLDARRSGGEVYDGVAELWWDSAEDIVDASATPAGRAAGRVLLEDERRFLDLERCSIFFVEEHTVL